ncbi:hypothetical protein ZIOFF_026392 [Zingiber officinale]|uniref:Uncharacterized protein n=1 Tax=Zingiber officinale TaxID=94328 RepID=A0A8J5H3Z1_ZINOF|nr:hypothetical protein ZIOFF_026392 [Zingiber officinale]
MGVGAWSLEDAVNSGFTPVWGLHENLVTESVEELKHKLLCATLELESLRANAKEEMRKNEENISQLLQLLQVITQQRDQAREQLQLLLTNMTQPESPQVRQRRGSSNITESDSLSGTPKNHSYGGSPAHSLFNVAASPELLSMKTQGQDRDQDMASVVMDELAMRPLPQKGKLLQAVLEAGPLLQTLLLAGPLPQWRNPPPLQQFQVPPVSINAHKASSLSQKVATSSNDLAHCSTNLLDSEKSKRELHIHSPDLPKRSVNLTCMRSYDNMSLKRQKTQCTGVFALFEILVVWWFLMPFNEICGTVSQAAKEIKGDAERNQTNPPSQPKPGVILDYFSPNSSS